MYKNEITKGIKKYDRVQVICDVCVKEYETFYKYSVNNHNKWGKHLCKICAIRATNSSTEYRKKMSEAIIKRNLEHPEISEKISKTHRERKTNVGDKNGMKNTEARKKVSETRKRKFKDDPEFAKKHADMTKKSWADEKHEHTKVGRCKWYDYVKRDGALIKCQGTWEWAFVKWADNNGLNFTTHKGRIEYSNAAGEIKNYYPDFYVVDWECYVDTKSKYFFDLNKEKIECILKSNPGLKLKILGKEELQELCVDLNDKPPEYKRKKND
jgi:hypothetical protein